MLDDGERVGWKGGKYQIIHTGTRSAKWQLMLHDHTCSSDETDEREIVEHGDESIVKSITANG